MSHMIENNQIAYVGATPWHGLGVEVPEGATGAEMLVAAGLDWKVEQRNIYIADRENDGCGEDIFHGQDYKAIVRADSNKIFSIPSKKYEIVQNDAVVDLFREYCEAGHARMETVGALRGGAVVWALAKLNGGSSLTIGKDDTVNGYVLFTTSHDGSMPTLGKATQVRVVCHNTLTAALNVTRNGKRKRYDAQFKMRHTSKWTPERAAEAREKMGIALETSANFNATCAKLADARIDEKGRIEFINRLLGGQNILDAVVESQQPAPGALLDSIVASHGATVADEDAKLSRVGKAILDAMLTSPGSDLASAKDTFWGAINGVTAYCDHTRGRTQDARLYQSWYGVGDTLKTDAMNLAIEMTGIHV